MGMGGNCNEGQTQGYPKRLDGNLTDGTSKRKSQGDLEGWMKTS